MNYTNRYLCDVLHELRTVIKNNESHYPSRHMLNLVEEIQTGANRMESALSERKYFEDSVKNLAKRKRKFNNQIDAFFRLFNDEELLAKYESFLLEQEEEE